MLYKSTLSDGQKMHRVKELVSAASRSCMKQKVLWSVLAKVENAFYCIYLTEHRILLIEGSKSATRRSVCNTIAGFHRRERHIGDLRLQRFEQDFAKVTVNIVIYRNRSLQPAAKCNSLMSCYCVTTCDVVIHAACTYFLL